MEKAHVISDSLFDEAQIELSRGNNWIAYNANAYYLDNADMWFFTYEDEAKTFAVDNISDVDGFNVIKADSIISLMRQLPYGEDLHFNTSVKALDDLFRSFDWSKISYDPLTETMPSAFGIDKSDISRMEMLLVEWENLYERDPTAALELAHRYWNGQPMQQYKDDLIIIKNDFMNEKNFDYLKSNVRNHGFGETLASDLEAQLQKGAPEFTLPYKTEVNKRDMEATLYFKKSDTTDMYFFNKYDTRLKSEKDETLSQTFYINNGWGVTLKEAYNLLNGRAVHKELTNKDDQKYKAWIQLDFGAKDAKGNFERKQYHQNYGYDLKEALSYYFIKEMGKETDMESLVRSLERGNVQMVNVTGASGDVRVFIEANPQYKSINVYDGNMKRLNQDQREELMKKPDLEKGKDKKQEQSLGTEGQDGKKSEKVKGKKAGGSEDGNGLVTKKRTKSSSKGLGV